MDEAIKDDNRKTVTIENEVVINKVKLKITSIFIGEQPLTEKLFTIADRTLKNC